MTSLRIGIIGAGANTIARHIPGLLAQPGVTIAAVCNRSRASSQAVAVQFGIGQIYERWEDLAVAPELDAVVIGTSPYLHSRATVATLSAGKHVLCEARMARDAAEAHLMLRTSHAHPRQVAQIVPSPMTLRVDRTIARLIAEGYLGHILAIEIRAGGSFLDIDGALHWRQDAELSGYNVLSLGIWYEAMLRWVGEASHVSASGRTFVPMRTDGEGRKRAVRVPEHLDVVADLVCGVQAHIQVSAVTGHAGPHEAWIFGSRGTLRFCNDRLYGGQRGDTGLVEIAIRPEEAGGWRVEEEFINAIRGTEPVTHTTFDDGVKYMEFTEAVARSIASRRAISLPLGLG